MVSACGGGGGSTPSPAPAPAPAPAPTPSPTPAPTPTPTPTPSPSPSPGNAQTQGDGPFIVVDQFGYTPMAQKIAVIRDPVQGFDEADAFSPGSTYQLINSADDSVVLTGSANAWNAGATHSGSGDRAWWFDFSSVQTPGEYFVRDLERNIDSPEFSIATDVYDAVLKQAFRTFFYQRAGFAKQEPYAEAGWVDGASHLGAQQDSQARLYSDSNNAATEKDLSGGWYDAGDYNKYTNWTADYVISLLHSYRENPNAWGDNFDIPESGNGISDILDEAKWGMDWLIKMQNANGSVLSIVGLDHASPPSAATGQSLYGSESTSATLTTASAFAIGAEIFGASGNSDLQAYANDLSSRAELAWTWANANPNVIFRNNDAAAGTSGLGAGQQEVDDSGRILKKIEAAIYLYELTSKAEYRNYVEANYDETLLIRSSYASAFQENVIYNLLHYATLENIDSAVADDIHTRFTQAIAGANVWPQVTNSGDPYLAYLQDYTWGSSSVKARKGMIFYFQILFDLGTQSDQAIHDAAQNYLHYLHGVNPLGKAYLSNMGAYGAENSVDQFYHTWFAHGSADWDSVRDSTYGPPPGFVVGGANPSYNWDACCPGSCGNQAANDRCGAAPPSPPFNQPRQKSYFDFNDSWPLNSWSVTENSNGYQVAYLRLLSKYVDESLWVLGSFKHP
jgi:endoglucanase